MENIEDLKSDCEVKTVEKWDDYDLDTSLLRGIYSMGFENPSQIQKTAILPMMQKRDVIAQAPSGTGKTGAFTVGTLHNIDVTQKKTQALILAPTHELVRQITAVVKGIGSMMDGLVVKTLVGGTSVAEDAADLKTNIPHIIVGSIGRVNDMIRRRNIKIKDVKLLVLDEADEMLSGGFLESVYNIFQSLDQTTQTAIFSATMPPEMLELTNKFMRDPVKIIVEAEKLNLDGIRQYYIALQDDSVKFDTLKDLYSHLSVNQMIVYANSVNRVVELFAALQKENFAVCSIHSSMTTGERNFAIQEFRGGKYRVLISSDVTARGIDIQQVSTVINFDIPRSVHTYLHRIGRSGRWGRKGLAINFITKQDVGTMKNIENHYKSTIEELPSNFAANV
jgi:translation initiation factor 4A